MRQPNRHWILTCIPQANIRPAAVRPVLFGMILCGIFLPATFAQLHAQAVTTGVIRGTVGAADGSSIAEVRVTAVSSVTGFRVETDVRHGRFFIQGVEIGGPYTIRIRSAGFVPQGREGIVVKLGEPIELHFVLERATIPLDTVRVSTSRNVTATVHGGTGAVLSDSVLHRLPTLNRDLYDFVRLVPQISTKVGFRWGFSGGGVGIRYNNFLINGVPERNLVNATAALAGGRSIPLDAVREYEVLVAPYDVRFGDFAGAVINSVTRSGTNRFQGSAFVFVRNDRLAGREAADTVSPYDRLQYGLSIGGPLVRDRLHFYVAAEQQRLSSPAPGPRVGQPGTAAMAPLVTDANLARLTDILRGYGLEAGSAGSVNNRNPLTNVFGRLDLAVPTWNSRAALWLNYDRSEQGTFSRSVAGDFPLSSMQAAQRRESWLASVQLHTVLPRGGGHNEVLFAYRSAGFDWVSAVHQPIVSVGVLSPASGVTTIRTGTFEQAHGAEPSMFRNLNVVENLTLPVGDAHVLTVGAAVELFDNAPGAQLPNSYGTWVFSSLDSLAAGIADRFIIRRDFDSEVNRNGHQFAAYVSDQWQVSPDLSVTLGLRGDLLGTGPRPPYNPMVDSIFGRRTNAVPDRRVELSPRLGFIWDIAGSERDRLRGGIGLFTGRPPPNWLHAALSAYGARGVLRCGPTPSDRGPAPPFDPDLREAPTSCRSGPDLADAPNGDVNLLAPSLRPARAVRASFAYDRRLPWEVRATGEILATRNTSDFEFVNLNLAGPQAVDRHSRVLYGSIVTGNDSRSGIASPLLLSPFSEVIELRNTTHNHAWQLSVALEKPFSDGHSMLASYTYSRVRDVDTPLRTAVPYAVNWSARPVYGRHDDRRAGISLNDVPHRIVLAGTFRAPWRAWPTELAFYYVGESGNPFTFLAYGAGTRGDLNADGSNTNDPIYIPRNAFDTTEIRFIDVESGGDNSTAARAERVRNQQATFEQFIERRLCLRRQRGRHMERNSCREPWTNTTAALVRQQIPLGRRAIEAELQLFNVLDLLHGSWGQIRLARPGLLEHVAHTAGTSASSQPIFRFNATAPEWTLLESASRFQLQVALRYRF